MYLELGLELIKSEIYLLSIKPEALKTKLIVFLYYRMRENSFVFRFKHLIKFKISIFIQKISFIFINILFYPAWTFSRTNPNESPTNVIAKQIIAVEIISFIIFIFLYIKKVKIRCVPKQLMKGKM